MIHAASEFLEGLLESETIGLSRVFTKASDLAAHKTPPYAAVIIDQRERYRRTGVKAGYEDKPEEHRRVYRFEVIRAVLPVSVLLVHGDRKELSRLRKRLLAALPKEIEDEDGEILALNPVDGEIIEDASKQRGGVAIDIVIEFEGGIYREEIAPYFTEVELEGVDVVHQTLDEEV